MDTPREMETATAYRAELEHGAELYLPPWFTTHRGAYDLVVHFHGLPKLQEANVERAHLDVAVVTVNLGAGTTKYARAFKDPEVFPRLLAEAHAEIVKSGRAPADAKLRRLALSAWSAGYVSVDQVLKDPATAERVDAVLLADGFFTTFSNKKKRIINTHPLERYVKLAASAERDEKLFAITHSAIPTVDYPSMDEVCSKFLEMTAVAKTPSSVLGPRDMREVYVAERGSFHLKGYEGVTAKDHINQIKAMGDTLYPYLRERWARQDDAPVRQAAPAAPVR